MSSSARRTAACGNPITTTETRISSRRPSRQTTQPVLSYALAVGLSPGRKVATLAVAGALGITGGLAWGQSFPIIKNLWTSSFVLLAGGTSALLLANFYLVIDVLGYRRWSYFFVVIGANAITIYWLRRFVAFGAIAEYFLGGTIRVSGGYGPLVAACGTLAAEWVMLLVFYRNRIFLRD